ncbi:MULTISPECIES: hypothetical protein [unclassified Bacillus (in: firmicutes)]|uniref:hypothetical protein n=1 Tax=unclassified Bacillus (in: firmicutes) TaxID=185979 RepID=UPI0008F3F986|nr:MULTISPECIES: hypothetical protein [unclassified Bacillus (in: firmicutes)]SFA71390.1 hypothetical protein SAMN02799634_101206 [Bacillus sp. UNCCL13]SFQ61578.1 hypothetical protein SAMN04488577_0488 [Bacillus sp. cl95]
MFTLPEIRLRELTLEDIEDRYLWCLDYEVTKHLNMPDKYPPISKEETKIRLLPDASQ